MKRTTQAIVSTAAALLAMGLSGGAVAQQTWNYGDQANNCNVPGACTQMPGGSGASATATATGYGTSGAAWVLGGVTNQGGSGLGFTSGGGENGTAPDHAFDNRAGSAPQGTATTEMLLINFSSKVNLTSLALGWMHKDSDLSVLRWDGPSPTPSLGTTGAAGLAGAGWALVSSRDVDNTATATAPACTIGTASCDLGAGSFTVSSGTGYNAAASNGKVSSWWMISTYFGASAGINGQHLDTGNDFFKILSFTGTVCANPNAANGGLCTTSVPEPASLALVSLALVGMARVRRRRAAV